MRNFDTNELYREFQHRTILISGNGRSGTTILGKIIGSMEDVEYFFEPPSIWGVFNVIDSMDVEMWKYLYNICLYEELFMNAIAGRNLNFNEGDDSYIIRMKGETEIQSRLKNTIDKNTLGKNSTKNKVAFKLPDLIPNLSKFTRYFPGTTIVIIKRNASDTINSIYKKNWFNDASLDYENRIWPMVKYRGKRIPPWVKNTDYDLWLELDTINKSAYYYLMMNEDVQGERIHTISYDSLVNDPQSEIESLSRKLGLKFGEKTQKIIGEIEFPKKERISDVASLLREEIRNRLF